MFPPESDAARRSREAGKAEFSARFDQQARQMQSTKSALPLIMSTASKVVSQRLAAQQQNPFGTARRPQPGASIRPPRRPRSTDPELALPLSSCGQCPGDSDRHAPDGYRQPRSRWSTLSPSLPPTAFVPCKLMGCKYPQMHFKQMLAEPHVTRISQGTDEKAGMACDIHLCLRRQWLAGPGLQWPNEA